MGRCWALTLLSLAVASWQRMNATEAFSSPPSRRSATPSLHGKSSVAVLPVAPPSTSTTSLAAAAASSTAAAVLDFYAKLDNLYDQSSSLKCPFIRRRVADAIDGTAMLLQFLLIRHKSLPGISDLFLDSSEDAALLTSTSTSIPAAVMNAFSAPGCKPLGRHIKRHPDGTASKTRHLSLAEISQRIHRDWAGGSTGADKGYYITGKLDSTIYRDDCLFTGPDPDMPVRGLRKYLSAAAQLFDQRESFAELASIRHEESGGQMNYGMVEVKWRLGGIIMLPWHPWVEPWTGWTRYHLDEEGLVYFHEEGWDISVWRAFVCTLIPGAREWSCWKKEKDVVT